MIYSMDNNKISRLTSKQKELYDSLRRLTEKNGESPTVAELVKLIKFSSPRAVTQYLESLERKGLIERRRYERRGIRLVQNSGESETVTIPVIASAGCDQMSIFAEKTFGDYICVSRQLLQGLNKDNVVCVKAIGNSMDDAGIKEGDYVLVVVTEAAGENDPVAAIIDYIAVIN